MKLRFLALPLAAALVHLPAPAAAQEPCTCPRPGMIGVVFSWDQPEGGNPRVHAVAPGGGAERAGLREGDVVLSVDGEAVRRDGAERFLETLQAGDTIRVRVRRDEVERELAVVATDRTFAVRGGSPLRGAAVHGLTPGAQTIRIMPRDSLTALSADSILVRIDSLQRRMVTVVRGADTPDLLDDMDRAARQMQVFIRGQPGTGEGVHFHDAIPLRDGAAVRIDTLFAERVESLPHFLALGARSVAGAELAELNEGLSRYFGVGEGILVVDVAAGTPAGRAGLEPGDVVVAVGESPVQTVRDLRAALQASEAGRIRLQVVRQGTRQPLELEWQPHTVRIHRPAQPPRP
jgi:predicted metalloprotease with PDZ domain